MLRKACLYGFSVVLKVLYHLDAQRCEFSGNHNKVGLGFVDIISMKSVIISQ